MTAPPIHLSQVSEALKAQCHDHDFAAYFKSLRDQAGDSVAISAFVPWPDAKQLAHLADTCGVDFTSGDGYAMCETVMVGLPVIWLAVRS